MSNNRNVGDIVWAYAYTASNNKEDKKYYCKPTKGVISADYMNHPFALSPTSRHGAQQKARYFIPQKKNGNGYAWSKAVKIDARHYANTETEAIAGYNRLIDSAIDFHKKKIDELNADKI